MSFFLLLALSPVLVFGLHAIANRLLIPRGWIAHRVTFYVLVFGNLPMLLLTSILVAEPTLVSYLYTVMVYNGFCFTYFQVFNIAETSLHMHILMKIELQKRISFESLKGDYSNQCMISARLERLTKLGHLAAHNGRYIVTNKSLIVGSKIFDFWKILLRQKLTYE